MPTNPTALREETDDDRVRQQSGQQQLAAAAAGGSRDPYRVPDDLAERYAQVAGRRR